MSTASPAGARWIAPAVLAVGSLVAFVLHFRPWEVAFLEEWPLAEDWMASGPLEWIRQYAGWSLSRPLHLVPTALGLALAGGAPGGIFVIIGVVAALQFLMTVWALRPVSRSIWASTAIALVVALHPLFPGGYLQRFLPAQTGALALVIMIGLLIRWHRTGRMRWIVSAPLALLAGLLVYPGPAAAAPLAALVVSLAMETTWRRRVAAVVVTTAASALVTVYSLLITRLVAPDAGGYEAGNLLAGSAGSPTQVVQAVGGTLLSQGLTVVAGVLAVAVLGALLALCGAIPDRIGWLISGTALVSPACAIVFFGNLAWLADPERVAYATSLGLTAALLLWPIASLGTRPRLEAAIAILLAALALAGGVRGIQKWQPYIALQHQLFAELAPVVAEADGEEIVVVIDRSGTYGFEYTLPQYYVSAASHVMNHDDTEVWLCYEETDPPLGWADPCEPEDIGPQPRYIRSFSVPAGEVDLYISSRDAG